ncbi:MAG: SDR family NAD(P)-dependent oxidoreductase [Bacteroidota bacterium]
MLLTNKNAIIYGAGGAVGRAVALAFAREGASVFLAGRTLSKLEKVAAEVSNQGGVAHIAKVDAHHQQAVDDHLKEVVRQAGRIDISFNLISLNDVQGSPLTSMSREEFEQPIVNAVRTHFITATSAARYMKAQGSGVILALTANAARYPFANVGGFGIACAAMEAFCRQLAVEVGKQGVRVVCLRSAGSPDAPSVDEVFNHHTSGDFVTPGAFESYLTEITMLKRLPRLSEVANTAVLMAADHASAVTAAVMNVTCGGIAD